jgi:predicted MPP superfamily phosphohydrolase
MINMLKSDIVVFTGDLVNNYASEFDQWVEVFNKIEAPLGKFSILGNHDYGEYVPWDTLEEKQQNLEKLINHHANMGFNLLLNQSHILERDGQKLVIAGVENYGLPPFPQYGDLDKALTNISKEDFTVLLSHDPSHWDEKVINHSKDISLTLSGHTHGMQFGIEIPGFIKWSPVKYKYPRWAGLYQVAEKFLYVNRGFGFIGFSGRVGIWPEITKITLRSA